jgi:hypothetical protein
MDAQGAWAALGRRYLDSPAARLGVTWLTREIQDLRISNSHTGSIEAFITGFTQKVTDRDNMVPAHQRFSDSVKIEMLHHDACYGHRDLRSVRTQIDCLQLTSGRILTYHEITQLYKVTAAPLDNEKFGSSSNRQSNQHDFHDNDGQPDHEDPCYDVKTSQSRTNKPFVKRAVRLPKDTWHSLSPSDQKNWDTLSDQAKDLIIKSQAAQASQARPRQAHHTETHDSSNIETDDNDAPDDKGDDVPNLSVNNSQRGKSSDSQQIPSNGQKTPSPSPSSATPRTASAY